MKNFISTLYVILSLSFYTIAQTFDSKATLYSTSDGFQGWYTESVYSPIDSYNDDLYFVMLDDTRRPMVGKISSGNTSVLPLDKVNTTYKPRNDGHHEYSIGIDNDGYIHITGDMHNYPQANTSHIPSDYNGSNILYWKSKNPEDISDFEFVGNKPSETIPGEGWGYGHFVTDRNGKLYYSSRTLARNLYWQNAGRGLGLYEYSTTTKSWEAKGVTVPESDASYPVIAWEKSGRDEGSYQQYKSDIMFDENNRMHIVSGMNTQNGPAQVNSIIYAFSNDGGDTFYRADSTAIKLPMRVAPGPEQADVLLSNPSSSNQTIEQPTVTAAFNNYPVVQYKNGGGFYKYWNGNDWSSAQSSPISTRDKILFNEHTEELLFIDIHSGKITSKTSMTSTSTTYDVWENFRYYDIKTFRNQNILTGVSWRSSTGEFKVIQLKGEQVDCAGVLNGEASIDNCDVCSGGNTAIEIDDCITSLNEQNNNKSIYVFPNPTLDQIMIKNGNGNFFLFNQLGEEMLRCDEDYISLKDLSAGIYTLQSGHEFIRVVKK